MEDRPNALLGPSRNFETAQVDKKPEVAKVWPVTLIRIIPWAGIEGVRTLDLVFEKKEKLVHYQIYERDNHIYTKKKVMKQEPKHKIGWRNTFFACR